MNITLESVGGFTGPAGKQVIHLDLTRLPKAAANDLGQLLTRIPANAWGGTFLAAHPRSWDFRLRLCLEDDGRQRTVVFHRNQGPPELTAAAELIFELQ